MRPGQRPAPAKQGATKDTRYFSLSTADSGLEYEAGDALGVWPSNCPELVDELIGLSGLAAETVVNVSGVGVSRGTVASQRTASILDVPFTPDTTPA